MKYGIVIIPTYNEKENINFVLKKINKLYPDLKILVVDDSSPDGTADIVRDFMLKNSQVDLLVRKSKDGLGEAYKEALDKVRNDKKVKFVFTMDADGSHDPIYIRDMMKALDSCDVVVGSRYIKNGGVENWEKWRLLLSGLGNIYSRILTGVPIHDLTAGFVGMRRSLLDKIDFSQFHSEGYAYQIEFKSYCFYKLKASISEVPIVFKSRRGGESKLSNHIVREGVLAPLRILWRRFFRI